MSELSYHFSKEIIFMNADYIYQDEKLDGSGYPYELHQSKKLCNS
jgi:response regulator RpfG family c-di-GMP phosphodiesterase